jgi:hypothetical protein
MFLSLLNTLSFFIASTPLKVEYLIDFNPVTTRSALTTATIAGIVVSIILLILSFFAITKSIESFSKRIVIFTTLVCTFIFFFASSPQNQTRDITWQQAIQTAKSDIKLNYIFKDPMTLILQSLKFKIPVTGSIKLSNSEKKQLTDLGFRISDSKSIKIKSKPIYKKIIMIVIESLDRDYLHYYNKKIPAEASYFFDKLIKEYPTVDNFYSSNYPTSGGHFAFIFSRVPYDVQISAIYGHLSLFSIFKQVFPSGKSILLRNYSENYGEDKRLVKNTFKADKIIAPEQLIPKYSINYNWPWGVRNDVVFTELLQLLSTEDPLFVFSKTLDSHFPYYIKDVEFENIPDEVVKCRSPIIKTVWYNNMLLEKFFNEIKEKGLFTKDTLFIITSDHTPNPNYGHLEVPGIQNFEQLGKIPLIFVSANTKPFAKLDRNMIASQVDIPVTLSSLLGIVPPRYYMGRDLTASSTLPLSIGHINDCYSIKTDKREFIIPQSKSRYKLSSTEKAIMKYFDIHKTVDFNKVSD